MSSWATRVSKYASGDGRRGPAPPGPSNWARPRPGDRSATRDARGTFAHPARSAGSAAPWWNGSPAGVLDVEPDRGVRVGLRLLAGAFGRLELPAGPRSAGGCGPSRCRAHRAATESGMERPRNRRRGRTWPAWHKADHEQRRRVQTHRTLQELKNNVGESGAASGLSVKTDRDRVGAPDQAARQLGRSMRPFRCDSRGAHGVPGEGRPGDDPENDDRGPHGPQAGEVAADAQPSSSTLRLVARVRRLRGALLRHVAGRLVPLRVLVFVVTHVSRDLGHRLVLA